ncbi:putative ferric-chelate reductase 1 isoform X3 [Oncorhynchus tshawytscha]|uniref:putative ferric-chelate reductase 1 isoform X3 n=1 Tax=Oncorhynchus tshawytscha TaxID=74940 RepID=UPI001C3DDFB7|nr:putative ferric-chelate reductase 1 isoform X3 [Oncorhynchus tshawytscha]
MDNISRLMFAVVMAMAYMAMGAEAQNTTMAPNSNATMANVTMAPNVTMTPVTALMVNISMAECKKSQLCAAKPPDCDPAVAGSCFFVSIKKSLGQIFSFQLRGVSSGYIAVGLSKTSTQGQNDTTYVCANNNGKVKFFTALLDKGVLTINNKLPVESVKGSVNGQTIQCTFSATVPNATATRSIDTNYYLSISNGTFNSVTDTLGSPQAILNSDKAVDLNDPNTTVLNSLNSAPSAFCLSQALLILIGVLGMMML